MLKAKKPPVSEQTVGFSILYEMFESISTEIKVLCKKIEAIMSHNVTNTSKTTVSSNSSKNSTQFQGVPVSPRVLPTATLVQEAIRGSSKITNFTHSMEPSMPKVYTTRPVSESTVPK